MSENQEAAHRSQNQIFTQQDGDGQSTTLPAHMAGLPLTNEGPAEYRHVDDLGFEVPIDVVPIPSLGKCYSVPSPLAGQHEIPIRAMTAMEEDILTSKAFLKNGTIITQLLRSCITDKRVNPADMLSGDRQALMVALRITSYGPDYDVDTECPECGHKQSVHFDLQELPVKFMDVNPDVAGTNAFTVTLPVTKKRIKFRLLTGLDEQEIQQEQQIKKKKLHTLQDNIITSRLMRQIIAVDGREDKGFIMKFIRNMPAGDSRFLRSHIAEIEPGMEMVSMMTCQECGEVSEVDVQIGPTFFWPK